MSSRRHSNAAENKPVTYAQLAAQSSSKQKHSAGGNQLSNAEKVAKEPAQTSKDVTVPLSPNTVVSPPPSGKLGPLNYSSVAAKTPSVPQSTVNQSGGVNGKSHLSQNRANSNLQVSYYFIILIFCVVL